MEVVAAVRRSKRQAAVARQFSISRVRVNQILSEHAPELLSRPKKVKKLTTEEKAERSQQRQDLLRILRAYDTRKEAARYLGLTPSGLYSRMRRLGIRCH